MGFRDQSALMKIGSQAIVKYLNLAETIVTPAADIFETEENFVVKLDMPGVVKEAIQVLAESHRLLIQASINLQEKEHDVLLYGEIGKKVYRREFNLGSGVDHTSIQAEFFDGVLTLLIPKNESLKTRFIHIS